MVKYLVKTTEKKTCENALKKFAKAFEKEFTNEIKKLRYRPVRKFLPDLRPVVFEESDGVVFAVPIKMPDFKKLMNIIAKFTGIKPEPKWKEKTVSNLKGYLKEVGIKFDSIEVVE